MTSEAVRMRDGPAVADLVTRAIGGDSRAWDALVERYIPLVWSICRGHRLEGADARTVSQTVWRQLAGRLGTLRTPAALAGWLATTTQQECDRIGPAADKPAGRTQAAERELLAAERHAALREAFAHLPPHCQQLIAMLTQDPPVPDAEISAKLGIPAQSIGRNCHDCLQRLRRHPAIVTLVRTGISGGR